VQADFYLLLCQRYIELNAVRAAMVDVPAHYRWRIYRTNGLGQSDSLLTPHAVYSSLGANEADRLVNYRSLFRLELDTEAMLPRGVGMLPACVGMLPRGVTMLPRGVGMFPRGVTMLP
jgi:hypothetical protein